MTNLNSATNNALSFVTTSVAKAVAATNIQSEVNQLKDQATNEIGRFEAMDEWLSNYLAELPVVVEGDVTIMYTDGRGNRTSKQQSLSDSLWVVTMKQLQYHLAVNYDLLSAAYANWINDSVFTKGEDLGRTSYQKVEIVSKDMIPTAKLYIEAMQSEKLDIVHKNISKKNVQLQAGNMITSKVFEMTSSMSDTLNILIEKLRGEVHYKCKPLDHAPEPWTSMNQGIANGAGLKLVARAKVKNNTVHQNVLDAVNKLQEVRYTVAPCIIEAAKDMTINKNLFTQEDYRKRYFSEKEVNEEAFTVYAEVQQYANKEFYFPVTMDARGRMYYRGGLLSPQGTDFCKAAFQFAEYKALGQHGFKAICLHVANVCGQDKLSINDRVRWVEANWDTIIKIENHRDIRKNFKGADVFQALVACKELARLASIDGDWSEKTSNLVCHMDGTCNGLQHMAAITGDRATAQSVNCVESTYDEIPADVYGLIAKAATKYATGTALELIKKYGRSMAKDPVMTTSYGAKAATITNNLIKFLESKNEDISCAEDIVNAYLDAINAEAGAVTQLTESIATRVSYAVKEGAKKFTWRTADGFLASTRYDDDESMAIRVGLFYTRKRNIGQAPLDERKTAQAMTPNFIHSIDATHLRMVVTGSEHELVAVHDSIGSHPSDYFETARTVREKFALVHNCYDALEDLCSGMKQPVPEFQRKGDYNAKEALKSAYIFS